jgi:hypothetical protein
MLNDKSGASETLLNDINSPELTAERQAAEKEFYDKFVIELNEVYTKLGRFSRNNFASQVKAGNITDYAGMLRYVAGNPYSPAAKLFVATGPKYSFLLRYETPFPGFVRSVLELLQNRQGFSFTSYLRNEYGTRNLLVLFHERKLRDLSYRQHNFLNKVAKGQISDYSQAMEFYLSHLNDAETEEEKLLSKFLKLHTAEYSKSGILSRSPFIDLVINGDITTLNALIKYVAANPHSRSAKIFATMDIPESNAYANFIKKHLQCCQASYTSYLGSFFTNTSNLLTRISKGQINNYNDIKQFAQDHPKSLTSKLMG